MIRLLGLIFLLLLGGSAFAQPVPPTGCATTTCTGTALPLGSLTVAGNQLQSGPGNNVRLACAVYRGTTGSVADFQAIRKAGFNCARIDWRDAYLSAASPPAGCNSLTQIQTCVANAKPSGLAVIFSHLGNEIPAAGSSCVFRQANGLWFDSGPDSGGADGCGDTGTVTAAAFQTNTVNLLGAFNGNSTVIGYELHNEPLVSGTFTGTGSAGGLATLLGAAPTFINNNTLAASFNSNIGKMQIMLSFSDDGGGGNHWSTISSYASFLTSLYTGQPALAGVIPEVSFPMTNSLDDTCTAIGPNCPTGKEPADAFANIVNGSRDSDIQAFIAVFAAAGFTKMYLRPGWEMNLPTTWPWGAAVGTGNEAGYVAAFQHIAAVVHAISNIQVIVVWCPGIGYSVTGLYPGNTATDIIGVDAYNDAPTTALTLSGGAAMAIANNKPFSIDEFGVNGPVANWPPWMSSTATTLTGIANLKVDHLDYYVADPAFGGDPVDTPSAASAIKSNFAAIQAHSIAAGGSGGSSGSGTFTVVNGQIFDPNGAVFIARGYAVTIGDALQGNSGPVSVSNIQRLFPRTNYIRIWGDYTQWTPSALSPWITALNNLGIVVSVEDYTGNGACRTGSDLAQANAWYATAATFYKTDAYVWFESQNECFNSPGSLSLNQITTNYNSVRSNNAFAMFGIGSSGGSPDPTNGQWYFTNIAFKPMSNIFFDIHPYAGAYTGAGVSATQSAYDAQLLSWIQTYKTWTTDLEAVIPVIAGEVGNCGNTQQCNSNNTPEATGPLAVKAAADVASVTGGTAAGASAGVGYWQWGDDGDASNVDTLVISGSATNPYGIQVQGLIASMPGTGPTPAGATGIPPINWGGGGPTDIRLACSTVGAAVFAVNPGVIQFCPGPINNSGTTLLNGTPKP